MKHGGIGFLVTVLNRSVIFFGLTLSSTIFFSCVHAATFTINSTVDASDVNLDDGICETVSGNGLCTLRAALQQSNALIGSDTINIPPGNYLNSDARSRAFTISDDVQLIGSGVKSTIIDAQFKQRVFWITPKKNTTNIRVVMSGFTIQNGLTDSQGFIFDRLTYEGYGAGILALDVSELFLRDIVVKNNKSDLAGTGLFIRCRSCKTEIQRSVFETNVPVMISSITNSGGGLYFISDDATSQLNISNTTLRDNIAAFGAGLYLGNGITTLLNSTVNSNSAKRSSGKATLPPHGGGIILTGIAARLNIVNSTLSGNVSEQRSAGIEIWDTGKLALYSSTIFNNRATLNGGGIHGVNLRTGSSITLVNSIVAGNRDNGVAPDCAAENQSIISKGYNLIGIDTGCNLNTAAGDLIGTSKKQIDPGIGILADNGGSTATHALLAGSVAINSADPNGCRDQNNQLLLSDQRGIIGDSGISRATDAGKGSARCDIGAFELRTAAPMSNAGVDLQVMVNTEVQLDGSSSQAFNAISSYQWQELKPGATVTLSDATLVNPNFTAPDQPSILIFELVITDSKGLVSSSTVRITVIKSGDITPPKKPDTNTNTSDNSNTTAPSSSGGCSVNETAVFDPLLLVLFLLAIFKLLLYQNSHANILIGLLCLTRRKIR